MKTELTDILTDIMLCDENMMLGNGIEAREFLSSAITNLTTIIASLPTEQAAEQDRWIAVSSGVLPGIDKSGHWDDSVGISESVLTYGEFGMRQGRYYHNDRFWSIDGPYSGAGTVVTHWQPLPPAPAPENKEGGSE